MTIGVDTHLYISNRFEVEDIKTVLENHLGCENVKIENSHTPSMFIMTFTLEGGNRSMHIHHTSLPTGPAIMLSLSHNEQAIRIMRTIGKAIGGILEERDDNGKMEVINGQLSDQDGLQYFLKWAVLNNKMPGGSIPELNQAIHDWHDRVTTSGREEYDLYPKEATA